MADACGVQPMAPLACALSKKQIALGASSGMLAAVLRLPVIAGRSERASVASVAAALTGAIWLQWPGEESLEGCCVI